MDPNADHWYSKPMTATLLMVGITVALAVVLYLMVSNLLGL